MKVILALDLASETGYAVQRADGVVLTGIASFLKTLNPGDRWIRFHDWTAGMLDFEEPQLIIFEQPFIHMKHASGLGISYGFKTVLEMLAARRGIKCYGISPSELKKWATGRGNADKSLMLRYARSMGWNLSNNNEVDAMWLLHFAQDKFSKKVEIHADASGPRE